MTAEPTPRPSSEVAQVRTSEKTRARLADLRQHPGNPRTISPARLAQLQKTLEADPDMLEAHPLIALPNGTVVAGNQRLAAAVALGWESIPVVYADLSPEEATRWMLLDNRGFGEDDREAVATLLGELEAVDSDLELTGYASADIDAMLRELHRPTADPDAAPPTPVEPSSRAGQVYELGPHRLMCGDSTNAAHVGALVGTDEPSLLLTDPPYGISLDMEWRDRAGLNGLGPAETSYMILGDGQSGDVRADWSEAFELVPSLTVAYVWHASAHGSEVQAGLERIGFEIVQQIIWAKTVFSMGRQHYQWQHEPCWYARRKGAKVRWSGGASQSTIWEVASPKHLMGGSKEAKVDHPTQKPLALYTRPLENHLRRGDIVYEPFGGSGSAIIAAEATGTRCLAMELDPRFVDVIRQRYADYTGRPELAP